MLSKNLCWVTGRVWVGCRLGTGRKIPTRTHTRGAPIPATLSGDPNPQPFRVTQTRALAYLFMFVGPKRYGISGNGQKI